MHKKVPTKIILVDILQRGIGNVNPMKMARCIVELERIYGIKNGGDRKSDLNNSKVITQSDKNNSPQITQSDLAEQIAKSDNLKITTSLISTSLLGNENG